MKKLIFTIVMLTLSIHSFGQWDWGINFESTWYLDRISIDTLSNPNCIWQIGEPNKSEFTEARSLPNAILTDIVNPVPPNDTSVFYLFHERDNSNPFHIFVLRFWYKMHGERTDFGKIEISPNEGTDWVNVLTGDQIYNMYWVSPKPTLNGSTDDWQHFALDISEWASDWDNFPIPMNADTIQFRFTYITDNSVSSYDGWMLDDIYLEDWWENISESRQHNLIDLYPNPTSGKLMITTAKNEAQNRICVFSPKED